MGEGNDVHAKVNGKRSAVSSNEQTPLLRNSGGHDGNQVTGDALISGVGEDLSQADEGNSNDDDGKASQRVGSLRVFFISLSMFALIFLQGKYWSPLLPSHTSRSQREENGIE